MQMCLSRGIVNDYFTRPDNKGRVFTIGGIGDRFAYATALRNGRLTMTFNALPGKVAPGEEYSFSISLLDEAMPEPVSENLTLKVVAARQSKGGGGGNSDNNQPDPEAEGDTETNDGRALPPTKWLTRDGRAISDGNQETEEWPDWFTDQDGGKVDDFGDGLMVFGINYDNAHFRRFLDRERDALNKKVITEQYRVGMLVLMMGLEDAYARMEQSDVKSALEEQIDGIRRLTAQGAATVVMSIAKTLSAIVNPASVADPDD